MKIANANIPLTHCAKLQIDFYLNLFLTFKRFVNIIIVLTHP